MNNAGTVLRLTALVCAGATATSGQAIAEQPAVALHVAAKQEASQPQTGADTRPIKTFYVNNVYHGVNQVSEFANSLRIILDPSDKITISGPNAITMRGSASEIELAQKILADLTGAHAAYRLTYTVTEYDGGKRIGNQHFALTTSSGAQSTLKQGSKVPIITGSYDEGKSGTQTQFTYLDIGLNFDATIDDLSGVLSLKSKVEQSSIAPEPSGTGTDPIVRQAVLENTSVLTLGKPLVLGSLDVPGSTRHLDIEVVVEPQR